MIELAEYKQRLRVPLQDTTLDRALAFYQARTLERRGQFDEAIAAYKKVLEYGPQDGVAYARLASLYVQRGLPRAAVMVYVALAEMHISRDRWEKAAAAYEKATELDPDDSDVHSALRDVYIRLGWLKEAAKVQARLDRILTETPKGAVAEPLAPPPPAAKPSVPKPDGVKPDAAKPDGAVADGAAPRVKPDGAAPAGAPAAPGQSAPPASERAQPAGPPAAPPEATRSPRRGQEPPAPAKDRPKAKEAAPASPAPAPPAPAPAAPGTKRGMRARTESLGQILLDQGMVSREQLEKAIQMHQRSGGHLGRILVELGAVTEQQLAQALAVQWGLTWVDLNTVEIDPDVVKTIPQHLAQRHKVLAIEKSRKRLKMAIADPLNVLAVDDVRLVTGLEIEPVVAAEADIVAAISRHYSSTVDLDEAMRAAVGSELEVAEERTEELSVEKLRTLTEEAPVVRLVNLIIGQAIADGASDIHIEPHRRTLNVRYRIDGVLHDVMTPPKAVQHAMVSRIKIMANMDIAERRIPQDNRIHVVIEGREYDLRVSTLPTVFGEKVVMRILDQSSTRLGLGKLGFTAAALETWEQLVSKPYGMVLVTGPTGSGKTTTLYSTLNKINTTDKNIITIEDPVEYQLARVNQVQVNVKAGLTFANGLRSFLRQDPDIIMVGEIRDRETAEIAIQASLTGHLVLSTVHTNDAPSATTRLIDMGIEPFLISSSLIGVLAQRLARTICSHCKESYVPPVEALHRLGLQPEEGEEIVFYRGRGCDRCKGSGYKGRIGIFELMVMSDTLRDLILKGASAAEIREAAIAEGMKTLREDGILKVLEGMTTVDELLRVVFVET
ncbi:MAG: type IV-A pilus assembly ATPase PilB [Armatimonadota bacterium]|nr:type IV-A pilus assembly ATPase PilB [Armatimonadota bacterium]MDR7450422.1 type IV-A pilus assembly ATPase PilB [Armatimonadota bacterium]MDR7466995.1 type IV-A pilus assembly ATPase PilB [Armatimonadota bacterium]MDR7493463.1 type IV-A pilus assembly ATPase PilB [Armatimonadota bacterium]MDR7498728.1 type IV-A pilus assembly ATPase PilB [Armatimonadota bacterium]